MLSRYRPAPAPAGASLFEIMRDGFRSEWNAQPAVAVVSTSPITFAKPSRLAVRFPKEHADEDADIDSGQHGALRFRSARKRGSLHDRDRQRCQDTGRQGRRLGPDRQRRRRHAIRSNLRISASADQHHEATDRGQGDLARGRAPPDCGPADRGAARGCGDEVRNPDAGEQRVGPCAHARSARQGSRMHGGSARSEATRRTALGRDYSLVAGAPRFLSRAGAATARPPSAIDDETAPASLSGVSTWSRMRNSRRR